MGSRSLNHEEADCCELVPGRGEPCRVDDVRQGFKHTLNTMKGYYSLIQFCPDASRLEAANIGLVVFCPEAKWLKVKVAEDNARIEQFFGGHGFDWVRVNSFKHGVKERLEIEGKDFGGVNDLNAFGQKLANRIQLTHAHPMAVRDFDGDFDRLFRELVL